MELRGAVAVAVTVDAMGEEEDHEDTEEGGSVCRKRSETTASLRDDWDCHVDELDWNGICWNILECTDCGLMECRKNQ